MRGLSRHRKQPLAGWRPELEPSGTLSSEDSWKEGSGPSPQGSSRAGGGRKKSQALPAPSSSSLPGPHSTSEVHRSPDLCCSQRTSPAPSCRSHWKVLQSTESQKAITAPAHLLSRLAPPGQSERLGWTRQVSAKKSHELGLGHFMCKIFWNRGSHIPPRTPSPDR